MTIRTAKTRDEMDAIHSLRYMVNMQELGKAFLFNNDDKTDSHSVLLYAKRNELLVGSLRCNFLYYNKGINEYWGIKKPDFKSKIALVDRLVIHPVYRNTRVAYDLTTNIYKQALLKGSHIALIETEEHLIKMYTKIGFQVYREVKYSYGIRYQMFINPWDAEYLRKINSPFFNEYAAYIQKVNSFANQELIQL